MPGNVNIRAGNKLQHEKKTCSSLTESGHAGKDGRKMTIAAIQSHY
jgi:hypothetical protein